MLVAIRLRISSVTSFSFIGYCLQSKEGVMTFKQTRRSRWISDRAYSCHSLSSRRSSPLSSSQPIA